MRYLKSFRESVINEDDLQDFCDTYLAYLLDDGFKVIIDNKYKDFITIRLTQSSDTSNPLQSDEPFIWDSIKDHYVPFLQMLSRNYKVSDFAGNKQVFVITGDHRQNNKLFYLSDVISGVADQQLGEMVIGSIIVAVSSDGLSGPERLRRQGIVESSSVNLQDELEYQAEVFLAPLEEEGFSYDVVTTSPARDCWEPQYIIRLSFLELGNSGSAIPINKLFDYTDVMDRFIPFVRMLSRRYDMSEWIYFYTTEEWDINKKVFSVDQIVNDEGPDYMVTTVKLTVNGKLQKVVESMGNGGNGCPLDNEVDKAEIMELCEPFMIPLMDDDAFEYGIYPKFIERYPFMVLVVLRKDKQDFSWGEVKDYVIPMFHMLCNRYMPDDWSVSVSS